MIGDKSTTLRAIDCIKGSPDCNLSIFSLHHCILSSQWPVCLLEMSENFPTEKVLGFFFKSENADWRHQDVP